MDCLKVTNILASGTLVEVMERTLASFLLLDILFELPVNDEEALCASSPNLSISAVRRATISSLRYLA